MKYWSVNIDYQSIPAMGEWHGFVHYVQAETKEQAEEKVTKTLDGLLGYNLGAVVKEISEKEWDWSPKERRIK